MRVHPCVHMGVCVHVCVCVGVCVSGCVRGCVSGCVSGCVGLGLCPSRGRARGGVEAGVGLEFGTSVEVGLRREQVGGWLGDVSSPPPILHAPNTFFRSDPKFRVLRHFFCLGYAN